MEQEGGGGGGDGGRRGEMNKQVHAHAHPQPQKCPRCDSFNTKFCYYNNYSLSQPRFFCKTCRRYWTQGGTLRNVPVGGGCRKGKKAKNSSAASTSNSSGNSFMPQQSQPQLTNNQSTLAAMAKDTSSVLASFSSVVPFYQGGGGVGVGGVGYMSSFAAFNQPLNPNPPTHSSSHIFDQALNVGIGSSSNLSLLQGFNVAAAAALGSSSQGQNRPLPQQFFQMGGNGGIFTSNSDQQGLNLIPPSTMVNASAPVSAAVSASPNENWPHSFINNGNTNRPSEQSLWSTINTTSISGGNSDRNGACAGGSGSGSGGAGADASGSASLAQNQWPDLSGFNPPQ